MCCVATLLSFFCLVADSDRAEGLLPYARDIPLDPRSIISYSQRLSQVTLIAATPSQLESTSIVLALGGPDIFCTRVSPSKGFDSLNPDFNRPFLVATVTLTLVLWVVTKRMLDKKTLKELWE